MNTDTPETDAGLHPYHGCFTGDCPHIAQSECNQAIKKYCVELEIEKEKLERERDEAKGSWHYANGVADLAMKHRDAAEQECDQLRKVCDELASELKDLRLSYVGLGGELVLARIESRLYTYNSLPHVQERSKP